MPVFHYEAVNLSGQSSAGKLEAADRAEAMRKLARRGLQPARLQQEGAASTMASKPGGADGIASSPLRLKKAQVLQFTEELCDLLGAGLQLEQALHAMEHRSSKVTRTLAVRLREKVRDGVPFSSALHQTSPSFGELYCNLVGAGEASGSLPDILNRQALYLAQMQALQSRVTTALIYPAFIIVSGAALGVMFLTYLLPKLAVLIESTHGSLPTLGMWLLALSRFLTTWWWAILAGTGLLALAGVILFRDPRARAWWDRAQLGLPIYGPVLRTRFEVQFLETLGNLIQNGLPLHRALELVRKATLNQHLRKLLGQVETSVADGVSLSRALEKSGTVRPLVIDMVRVGEQTGELSDALRKAGGRFEKHLGKTMDRATALLQPVIILVMAGMVGTMAWMMINVVWATLNNIRRG